MRHLLLQMRHIAQAAIRLLSPPQSPNFEWLIVAAEGRGSGEVMWGRGGGARRTQALHFALVCSVQGQVSLELGVVWFSSWQIRKI